MPRPRKNDSLTINALEQMLEARRKRVEQLNKDRDKAQKTLDGIDAMIAALNGGAKPAAKAASSGAAPARSGRGRAKNAQSLVAVMETVLKDASKPMPVGDIVTKVQAAGYRSSSANFRALLNQTLIKDKRFSNAGRGLYQLKK